MEAAEVNYILLLWCYSTKC